jgi:hypothetical protein
MNDEERTVLERPTEAIPEMIRNGEIAHSMVITAFAFMGLLRPYHDPLRMKRPSSARLPTWTCCRAGSWTSMSTAAAGCGGTGCVAGPCN